MSEELNTTTTEAQVTETQTEETKTYTQEEFDSKLQSEVDRRVSQALKTRERKQRESEKLRNMSDDDRRLYDLDQREKAIAEKEIELARAENKSEGLSILSEKGLSPKLIDLVLSDDGEQMYANIKLLEKEFKLSVKSEVEKRLASKSPTQSLPMTTTITKEQFKKMSLVDLMNLKNEQPELFEELKKQ